VTGSGCRGVCLEVCLRVTGGRVSRGSIAAVVSRAGVTGDRSVVSADEGRIVETKATSLINSHESANSRTTYDKKREKCHQHVPVSILTLYSLVYNISNRLQRDYHQSYWSYPSMSNFEKENTTPDNFNDPSIANCIFTSQFKIDQPFLRINANTPATDLDISGDKTGRPFFYNRASGFDHIIPSRLHHSLRISAEELSADTGVDQSAFKHLKRIETRPILYGGEGCIMQRHGVDYTVVRAILYRGGGYIMQRWGYIMQRWGLYHAEATGLVQIGVRCLLSVELILTMGAQHD